ncbi:hypothetical protein M3Y99_01282300 [Aphelenchoides fujianensis]|nr:hypothetical protein M3Y99_01282300 [Aphelenchoides fujianensis]
MADFYQKLRRNCREKGFFPTYGFYVYTGTAFGLSLLLLVKFFAFDRTAPCGSLLCEFQMTIVLFSLAFSTVHLSALLCGHFLMQRVFCFPHGNGMPLACMSAGIGLFIVITTTCAMTVYAANIFEHQWTRAALYCFLFTLQPVFTLLSVCMKQQQVTNTQRSPTVEQKAETESLESDSFSPRLTAALLRQWTDRLSEVELQRDPWEMRRTVREVLQHMNTFNTRY